MYEVGITYKNRRPNRIVSANYGAIRKFPGGMRILYAQGDYTAEVTFSNEDAIRLYHALGSILLPKPEVAKPVAA